MRVMLATLALSIISAGTLAAEEQPYQIEPVTTLCKAAANPANYRSSELSSFQHLVAGSHGWVYRSKTDFIEDFRHSKRYQGLARFNDALSRRGIRLVVMYYPTRGLINPSDAPDSEFNAEAAKYSYLAKLKKLREVGVLIPHFEDLLDAQNADRPLYFKRDIHWTPDGSRAVAFEVAKAIRNSVSLDPNTHSDVVITKQGRYSGTNSIASAIKQLCNQQYAPEYVQGYGYEVQSNDTGDKSTQVVVIGGGFTALADLNFIGFLQNELSTPVEDFTQVSGGLMGGWSAYLKSEAMTHSPPKVIVWEVPPYYPLDDDKAFAQLTPMLDGGCSNKLTVARTTFNQYDYNTGSISAYLGNSVESKSLRNLILELNVAAPDVEEVGFKAWYSDGQVRSSSLQHSRSLNGASQFVFELSGNLLTPSGHLIALELTQVNGQSAARFKRANRRAQMSVKVCSRGR